MDKVTIYTDGGCRGNGKEENIGAYAYIIDNGLNHVEKHKSFDTTTNNKMELLGLIAALESLELTYEVDAYSDSQYVCNAINNKWITNWQKNGWKTTKKEAVKNQDLWLRLIKQLDKHKVKISWVKGHSGNELNERCDALLNYSMDTHTHMPKAVEPTVVGLTTKEDLDKDVVILKRLISMRDELNDVIDMIMK